MSIPLTGKGTSTIMASKRMVMVFVKDDDLIAIDSSNRIPGMLRIQPSKAAAGLRAEVEAIGGSASLELDVVPRGAGHDAVLVGASLPSRPEASERRSIEVARDYWDIARGTPAQTSSALDRRVRAEAGLDRTGGGPTALYAEAMVFQKALSAVGMIDPSARGRSFAPRSVPVMRTPIVDRDATRALHVAIMQDPELAASMSGVKGIDQASFAAALQVTRRVNRDGAFDAAISFTDEAKGREDVRGLFGDGPMPEITGRVEGRFSGSALLLDRVSTQLARMENGPDGPVQASRVDSLSIFEGGGARHSSIDRSEFASTRDALFMEADRLFLGSVERQDRRPPIEIVSSSSPSLEDLKIRVASSDRGVVLGDFSMIGSSSSGRLSHAEDLRDAERTFVGKDGVAYDIDPTIGLQFMHAAIVVPAAEHRVVQERASAAFLDAVREMGDRRPDDLAAVLGRDVGREAAPASSIRVDSVRLAQGRARIGWSAGEGDEAVRGSALIRTVGDLGLVTLRGSFQGLRESADGVSPDGRVTVAMERDGMGLSAPVKSWNTRTDGYRLPLLSTVGSELYLTDPSSNRAERVTRVSPRLGMDLEAVSTMVKEKGGVVSARMTFTDMPKGEAIEIASLESVRRPADNVVLMSDDLIRSRFDKDAAADRRKGLTAQAKTAGIDRADGIPPSARAKGRDGDQGLMARLGRMARSAVGRD